MSADALCVGVCMIDWEAGVCLGCGRSTDEIHAVEAEPSPPVPTVADEQGVTMPAKDQPASMPPKRPALGGGDGGCGN